MAKHIYTVCAGRCGQISLTNYINKFSTNTYAEAEPPEPKYNERFIFSNLVRAIERKTYATDELLGRGKALIWHDNNENMQLNRLCEKRIDRSNNIMTKKKKEIYFEISKFFIRSYCEKTIEQIPNLKVLYLTRHPLTSAISFYNRKKIFEKDNFRLNYKKNIFKINDLNLFDKYLWMWIEIKLRLIDLQKRYDTEIIHYKSENIDNLEILKKLFYALNIKHGNLKVQGRLNTNKLAGFSETKVDNFFLDRFEKFKKKIPTNIKEKVPEFFNYDQTKNFI